MKTRVIMVALIAVGTAAATGCSETVYLGRLDVVTPATLPPLPPRAGTKEPPQPRPYPANVPRVVAVSGSEAELLYPGGGVETMPKDGTYAQLEIDNRKGALEGFIGGLLTGAGVGAASASGCSSSGCSGGVIVGSALICGAIGALYGAAVGHRTTYVLGPRP